MTTELSDITARITALETVLLTLLEHGILSDPHLRRDLNTLKEEAAETVCEMFGEGVPRDYQKTPEEYLIRMISQPLDRVARLSR